MANSCELPIFAGVSGGLMCDKIRKACDAYQNKQQSKLNNPQSHPPLPC